MNIRWKRVLIPCAIAAVLMLGIPCAGLKYFESQGIRVTPDGSAGVDVWVEEQGRSQYRLRGNTATKMI